MQMRRNTEEEKMNIGRNISAGFVETVSFEVITDRKVQLEQVKSGLGTNIRYILSKMYSASPILKSFSYAVML